MKPSIEETLIDWFGSQGLEIKKIEVDLKQDIYEKKLLATASGEFYPVVFDKLMDGIRVATEYLKDLAYQDERFQFTELIFPSETKFKIV